MKTINVVSGIGCVAIPVGYLVKKHIDWESSPQSKKRMLTHQLSFWTTMTAGLVLMHKAFYLKKNAAFRGLKQGLMFMAASILPILGFEWGGVLAMTLYPKQKKPVQANRPHRVYTPSYLSGGQTQFSLRG